jgi:hypothetical protein
MDRPRAMSYSGASQSAEVAIIDVDDMQGS